MKNEMELKSCPYCGAKSENLHSEILRLAAWIRELTGTAMAQERGIVASEVRGIAVKLEELADSMGVE